MDTPSNKESQQHVFKAEGPEEQYGANPTFSNDSLMNQARVSRTQQMNNSQDSPAWQYEDHKNANRTLSDNTGNVQDDKSANGRISFASLKKNEQQDLPYENDDQQ